MSTRVEMPKDDEDNRECVITGDKAIWHLLLHTTQSGYTHTFDNKLCSRRLHVNTLHGLHYVSI